LRFHVEEAGADAKLIQHGPLGDTYHHRHPISTVPIPRLREHERCLVNLFFTFTDVMGVDVDASFILALLWCAIGD
jgi:hypothetical protein